MIDVNNPRKPKVAFFPCVSPQGDVGVYGNLVFRSVDSTQLTDGCTTVGQNGNPTGAACVPVASPCTGFEGIQIFDISNLNAIKLIKSVALDCGSHTHTVVPEPSKNRVLIYNSVSGIGLQANPGKYGNRCPGPPFNHEDIVEAPLSNPSASSKLSSFDLGVHDGEPVGFCHDFGVILGKVNMGACAGHGVGIYDLTDPAAPEFMHPTTAPTVESFHSAVFSWNGTKIVSGWEPGGGTAPRCQTTGVSIGGGQFQTEEMKTAWIHNSEDGEIIGKYVLPRDQSVYQNCTIHNYNLIPNEERLLMVHGSYQSSTALVDLTSLTGRELVWMDPLPLDPPTATTPGGRTNFRGGDWSSYYYNGCIYESDTRRGLYIWKVDADELNGRTLHLRYLNPKTNHLSIRERD